MSETQDGHFHKDIELERVSLLQVASEIAELETDISTIERRRHEVVRNTFKIPVSSLGALSDDAYEAIVSEVSKFEGGRVINTQRVTKHLKDKHQLVKEEIDWEKNEHSAFDLDPKKLNTVIACSILKSLTGQEVLELLDSVYFFEDAFGITFVTSNKETYQKLYKLTNGKERKGGASTSFESTTLMSEPKREFIVPIIVIPAERFEEDSLILSKWKYLHEKRHSQDFVLENKVEGDDFRDNTDLTLLNNGHIANLRQELRSYMQSHTVDEIKKLLLNPRGTYNYNNILNSPQRAIYEQFVNETVDHAWKLKEANDNDIALTLGMLLQVPVERWKDIQI